MEKVSERDKLELQCRSTISYHFGAICDSIDQYVSGGRIPIEVAELLKKVVRNNGNGAIRVIGNHLDYYKVARNHRRDQINVQRVVKQATKKG